MSQQEANGETNASADQLLSLVVQSAPIGIIMADAKGHVRLANQSASELFGYSEQEWKDLVIEDLIPSSLRKSHQSDRASYVRHPEPRRMGEGRELYALRKDGREFPVEIGLSPIDTPEGRMVVASVIDISERRESEAARNEMAQEVERQAMILRNVHDAVFLTSLEGQILTWNEGAEAVYGYSQQEAVGQYVRILLPADDRHRFEQRVLPRVLRDGRTNMMVWSRHKSGARIALSLRASLLEERDSQAGGVIICAHDITEQKKLEDLVVEASEAEQRRIGRDIHDDLCQQLAGIGCLAKVLEQRLDTVYEDAAESLRQIGEMVSQANVRARDLARGLVPAVLEKDGLCGALKDLSLRTEQVYGVKCELWCPEPITSPDPKVAIQLYRIAQEAVSNAVKHGSPTQIIITLDRRDDLLRLDVRDDGQGMTEELDSSGMGLMTMEHRAQVLGGELEIHSNNEEGTHVSCAVNLTDPI